MELPESIQVGAVRYCVESTPEAIAEARLDGLDPSTVGYIWYQKARIAVAPDIAPDVARVELLHEVLHAIIRASDGTSPGKLTEEAWIGRVAPLLLDTLRRNPDLVAYLLNQEGRA